MSFRFLCRLCLCVVLGIGFLPNGAVTATPVESTSNERAAISKAYALHGAALCPHSKHLRRLYLDSAPPYGNTKRYDREFSSKIKVHINRIWPLKSGNKKIVWKTDHVTIRYVQTIQSSTRLGPNPFGGAKGFKLVKHELHPNLSIECHYSGYETGPGHSWGWVKGDLYQASLVLPRVQ